MLIRFVVSNFLSFNEETEFNMLAGSYKTHKHHVYKTSKLSVLKGVAIYGANGAGKSNFIKAMDFFQNIVKNGKAEKSVNLKKFKLNNENLNKPIEFEIEFYYKRKIYAYGISINGNTIEQEYLYLSGINIDDKLIFERKTSKNGKSNIKLAEKYLKTQKEKLLIELMEENLLKSNDLLLGKFENLNITDISNVNEWIFNSLVIIYPESKSESLLLNIINSNKFAEFVNETLNSFDTGIEKLNIKSIDLDTFFGKENVESKNEVLEKIKESNWVTLFSGHEFVYAAIENGKNVIKKIEAIHYSSNENIINFSLLEESDGTRRLLDLIPVINGILDSGITFIVDEIDQSLHPTLLHTLVTKIMSNKNTQGQLVFTTHESNLLDLNIFRQDEIWFAEKNKIGSTQLYPLSDYKPRADLDIRKGYLKGRFGAIPFTADLKNLNWEKTDA